MSDGTAILAGIPVAKRKFAELELSLLHLQQNVEIPEVQLVVDSAIRQAIERVCVIRLLAPSIIRITEQPQSATHRQEPPATVQLP